MLVDAIRKPDVSGRGDAEVLRNQYTAIRSLLDGAKAILQTQHEGGACPSCLAAYELLAAFDAGMEAAEKAAVRAQGPIPVITTDELKELVGNTGYAQIRVLVDRHGHPKERNFRMGTAGGLATAPPKASGKINGKAKGKAA